MLHLLPRKILIILRLGSYYLLFFYEFIMLHLLPRLIHCPLHPITPAQHSKPPTPTHSSTMSLPHHHSYFHNHWYAHITDFSLVAILAPGFCARSQISALVEYYVLLQNMKIPSTKSWYIDLQSGRRLKNEFISSNFNSKDGHVLRSWKSLSRRKRMEIFFEHYCLISDNNYHLAALNTLSVSFSHPWFSKPPFTHLVEPTQPAKTSLTAPNSTIWATVLGTRTSRYWQLSTATFDLSKKECNHVGSSEGSTLTHGSAN
jgi:hypothetical protein